MSPAVGGGALHCALITAQRAEPLSSAASTSQWGGEQSLQSKSPSRSHSDACRTCTDDAYKRPLFHWLSRFSIRQHQESQSKSHYIFENLTIEIYMEMQKAKGMTGQDEIQSYVHYLLACHLAVSPLWVVSRGGSSDQAGAEKHRQFFHPKNGNNNPPLHESFQN
ncbi:uncharacterized protein [Macaca nemestrina]|uniref:uncharacterized protein isoform X3 n=1 Tax=Macaca nemestrina TaxID=9545 RepID=UPI0039B8F180